MSGKKFGEFVADQPQESRKSGADQKPLARRNLRGFRSLTDSFGERLMIGPDGVRSGWRLFLYLSLATLLYLALALLTSRLQRTSMNPLWLNLVAEGGLLVVAVVPALVMARFEDRSFRNFGLPPAGALGRMFWLGLVWGMVAVTALMLALHSLHVFAFGHMVLDDGRIWKFAAYHGIFFLIVALAEEFLLRGYSLFTLSRGIGFWPAALVLSAVFGAMHLYNPGETWSGSAATAVIGLFFCLTLRRTGDLWFAVGFHAAWDWGESYLYSVPDSGQEVAGHLFNASLKGPAWLTGGSAGPEASVLSFLFLGLLSAAFGLLYRAARYPRSE